MFKRLKLSLTAGILFAGFLGGLVGAIALPSGQAAAACSTSSIIGIKPWYAGLPMNSDCTLKGPPVETDEKGPELTKYIWKIVLNVIDIVLRIIAYLAVIYIIYGGFLYITSSGNPDATARALKSIINASVGFAIALSAIAIKNYIWDNLIVPGSNTFGIPEKTASQILISGLNMAYFIAGVVAVIMVIVGGLNYVTSSGDSSKTAKAKNTILYAVIGIVVIIFAFAITTFINSKL